MVTLQLTEGEHTLTWSLNGYQTLTVKINVSSTGVITTTYPDVDILGNVITGQLTAGTSSNICNWVTQKGGVNGLSIPEIFELVDSYTGLKNIGFVPTIPMIMGCIDYRMGFLSSGNSKTGCAF